MDLSLLEPGVQLLLCLWRADTGLKYSHSVQPSLLAQSWKTFYYVNPFVRYFVSGQRTEGVGSVAVV